MNKLTKRNKPVKNNDRIKDLVLFCIGSLVIITVIDNLFFIFTAILVLFLLQRMMKWAAKKKTKNT